MVKQSNNDNELEFESRTQKKHYSSLCTGALNHFIKHPPPDVYIFNEFAEITEDQQKSNPVLFYIYMRCFFMFGRVKFNGGIGIGNIQYCLTGDVLCYSFLKE